MRKKLFIALPAAIALIAGSALWVQAAENETGLPLCADIIAGDADYIAPTRSIPDANAGWINPGSFYFTETLAAPSCPDVQYGIVVLAAHPAGGAPLVLASQSVPGDGISNEITFSPQVTADVAQEQVCVYLYTAGSAGGSTTTPSNGNPHSQTISAAASEMLDRAPDGTDPNTYCHSEGGSSPARSYN